MERWLPVVGFEGLYEVSDQGRVRSLRRTATRTDGRSRTVPGVVLRPGSGRGYRIVTFCVDYKLHRALVHRLVLEAFVGPCPAEHECAHLNGARDDNRLLNLSWVTRAENAHHKRVHGTMNHITPEAGELIRELFAQGITATELGQRFGCSHSYAWQVATGRKVPRAVVP